MSPNSQYLKFSNTLILGVILTIVWTYLLYGLYVDWSVGGNTWRQGDWLINSLAEPIRRGLLGSALLLTADVFQLSPLTLLIVAQASIITLIFGAIGWASWNLGAPDRLVLLLLSPGFLTLFWFNDPQGSMRKEILVYLAFVPLMIAAATGRGRALAIGLSMALFGAAVLAHEGMVFFLPFLWVALWMSLPPAADTTARVAVVAIPGVLAFGAGLYAVAYPATSSADQICMQVVQRGLDPSVCGGAIDYLMTPPEEGGQPLGRLLATHFRSFLLIYAACLLSLRLLFSKATQPSVWFLAVLASGLAFLPIYILAGDYGRWLNFHITIVTLVLMVYLLDARPSWLFHPLARLDYTCVLMLYLVIGVSHSPGDFIDGFLVNLARLARDTAGALM